MACSKYTLTNTGTTSVNFNYRRCDDSMWEYQVNLDPNQTKNIWLINGTYDAAQIFETSIVLVNNGVYPLTPTPTRTPTGTPTSTPTPSVTTTQTPTNTGTPTQTPTNTETPTQTPTQTNTQTPTNTETQTPTPTPTQTPTNTETPTQTPTNTGTQTPTPTNTGTQTPTPTNTGTQTPTPTNTGTQTPTPTVTPTNALDSFLISSGLTANIACSGSGGSGTIYAETSMFDQNSQFYNNSNGTVTGSMTGFYSYGGLVVELDDSGAEVAGFINCSAVPTPTPTQTTTITPTPTTTSTSTPTPTTTSTSTPTPTPTITPTASQTFFVTYSLGFDASTAGGACTDFATPHLYYSAYVDRPQPNINEYLYNDNTLTTPAADGYYSNGVAWWEITGGTGLITATDPNGC
jgi:hypothetical protein